MAAIPKSSGVSRRAKMSVLIKPVSRIDHRMRTAQETALAISREAL
jgi:hypothetical protein